MSNASDPDAAPNGTGDGPDEPEESPHGEDAPDEESDIPPLRVALGALRARLAFRTGDDEDQSGDQEGEPDGCGGDSPVD